MGHEREKTSLPDIEASNKTLEALSMFDKLTDQVGEMLSENYKHYLTFGAHYTPDLVVADTGNELEVLKLMLFWPDNQSAYSPELGAYRLHVTLEAYAKAGEARNSGGETDDHTEELIGKQMDMISVKRHDLTRTDRPRQLETANQELIRLELAVAQFESLAIDLSTAEAKTLGFSDTFIRNRIFSY